MWGFSHRAAITALAAQRSDDLRAGVCLAAPGDICWTGRGDRTTRTWVAALLAGTPLEALGESLAVTATLRAVFLPLIEGRRTLAETRREMIVRTPRLFAGRTRCPLLLAAGDRDDIYAHTVALDADLTRAGKAHEFVIFSGMGHAIQSRNLAPGSRTPWDVTFEFLWRHTRPRD
jgi:dipeptidyl aminopeptidase/acylaminoacyl peptidase